MIISFPGRVFHPSLPCIHCLLVPLSLSGGSVHRKKRSIYTENSPPECILATGWLVTFTLKLLKVITYVYSQLDCQVPYYYASKKYQRSRQP